MSFKEDQFPLQQVLELACAAQRSNNDYVKIAEAIYTSDGKMVGYKHANRTLMLTVLGQDKTQYSDPKDKPNLITTNLEDRELANQMQKYYRRLMFSAIEGDNEFQTKLNQLLSSDNVRLTDFGWIACLPSVFKRDYARTQVEKFSKSVDSEYLATVGSIVLDKDCEILASQRSKNFDAYNIDAIIENKMVSWMSKADLKIGACVVVKAKVKDHTKHWKYQNFVTRLNYVKAAQ